MLNVCKAEETLKKWENEMYVKSNIFLKHIEAKCVSEMKKYMKFIVKKS